MGYVIVIQNETYRESYTLTSDCPKPRLNINGSYIPVTTAAGGGL